MKLVHLIYANALFTCLLFAPHVWAHKYSVCDNGCDFTTIQSAIDNAQNHDIISVSNGTYMENLYIHDKSITIKGEDRLGTIVHANIGRPVVMLECTDDSTSIGIEHLTLTGADIRFFRDPMEFQQMGSGINSNKCELLVNDVHIVNNNSADSNETISTGAVKLTGPSVIRNSIIENNYTGGGIRIFENGSLKLVNSIVSDNASGCDPAQGYASAITNLGVELDIRNSVIKDNVMGLFCGKGSIFNNSKMTIFNTLVSDNKGLGSVYNNQNAEALLKNVTVNNNDRGAIVNDGAMSLKFVTVSGNNGGSSDRPIMSSGSMNIKFSTITDNENGGIYNTGSMLVDGSTILNNHLLGVAGCSSHGGGIYNSGELTLNKTMIIGNGQLPTESCQVEGGGIYNESPGVITAIKTIIEDNIPDNCAGTGFTCP